MKKTLYYMYLGTNGTITSQVYLENIYSVKKYQLEADDNHILVNGERKTRVIMVPENELDLWTEIEGQI